MTPEWVRAVALGALQGATEFLPVSSSGHLVIVPELLGWPPATLTYSVVVHWATALAVVLYFWRDWARTLTGAWRGLFGGRPRSTPELRLLLVIALATVPAVVVGLALAGAVEEWLAQEPRLMARFAATMLLVTSALLFAAEHVSGLRSTTAAGDASVDVDLEGDGLELPATTAGVIGVAQALAVAPGVSRSGATIATGLGRGLTRESAARFSFLLAAPIMIGAGVARLYDFVVSAPSADEALVLLLGFATAFFVGLAAIAWLMRFLQRSSLRGFAVYTFVAGMVSLWLLRGPG